MLTVYEARLPAKQRLGGNDRHKIHGGVDALLLQMHRDDTPRNFVWGRVDDTILTRSALPREGFFSRVHIPDDGLINFEFDAAPHTGHGGGIGRKSTRQPIPYDKLADWLLNKLRHGCGIAVTDLQIAPFIAEISRRTLPSAMIVGEGEIVDADLYRQAIITGIPGAGPKCWGFGTLIVNWE